MKPANFEYSRPADIGEAAALLEAAGIGGKVVAGGQSLMPMLNLRLAQPDILIDVTGLDELHRIDVQKDKIVFGACVTHAEIEDCSIPGPLGDLLRCVADGIGYRSVRNAGTIGGSLAHADPAADWPAALVALGAVVHIAGNGDTRSVAAEDFIVGPFTTALGTQDILESIEIPLLSKNARCGYAKISRKVGDFATALGAFVHDPARELSGAVVGATSSRPILLQLAPKEDGGVEDLRPLIQGQAPEMSDYEIQIHAVALSRAMSEAQGR